jgi:hypothetical protein
VSKFRVLEVPTKRKTSVEVDGIPDGEKKPNTHTTNNPKTPPLVLPLVRATNRSNQGQFHDEGPIFEENLRNNTKKTFGE